MLEAHGVDSHRYTRNQGHPVGHVKVVSRELRATILEFHIVWVLVSEHTDLVDHCA